MVDLFGGLMASDGVIGWPAGAVALLVEDGGAHALPFGACVEGGVVALALALGVVVGAWLGVGASLVWASPSGWSGHGVILAAGRSHPVTSPTSP